MATVSGGDKGFSQCIRDKPKNQCKPSNPEDSEKTLLKDIDLDSEGVTQALNLLLYRCESLRLVFLPLGFKSSELMVREACNEKFGPGTYRKAIKEQAIK